MGRIYENGAELSATTLGIEYESDTGAATLTADTSITRGSRYSWKINAASGQQRYIGGTLYTTDSTSTTYFKFDFYIETWNQGSDTNILICTDLAGTRNFQVAVTSSLGLTFKASGDAVVLNPGITITTGVWHTIQVEYDFISAPTYSSARVIYDGIDLGSATVGGAGSNNCTKLVWGMVGTTAGVGGTILYFDNIIANEAAGSNPISWVDKDEAIIAFRPRLQGDAPAGGTYYWALSAGAIGSGGTSNYTYVDEITPDTSTSWVRKSHTAAGDFTEDWYVPELLSTVGNIQASDLVTFITVNGQMGGTGTTSRPFTYTFKPTSGGTETESSNQEANANAWFMMNASDLPNRPQFVVERGEFAGQVESYQFGIKASMNDAREIRASTVYMNVSYIMNYERRLLAITGVG